ncbi:MAG: hypothetical protein GY946_01015, partial [bacterium]|nr:hypothetical protein [bacterium]
TDTGSGYDFTGSSGQQPDAAYSYAGPGSAYSVTLNEDGSFRVLVADDLESPVEITIQGTYERFANGYVELTVSEAEGVGAPSEGDVGMALEAPGFALILQPFDGTGEFVPTVVSGVCPAADVAGNWMMMTCMDGGVPCDAESTSNEFFGTYDYDYDTESASLPAQFNLEDGSDVGSASVGTTSCDDGIMSLADTAVYLSDSEAAIIHASTSDTDDARHYVAFPEEELIQEDLAGDYLGMGFDKSDDSSLALRMSIAAGGATGAISEVDSSELETAESGASVGTLAISSVNQVAATPADGWLTATFTADGEPARPMYCMVASYIGDDFRTLIFCVGQSPTDAGDFYNIVMVSEYSDS